MLVDALEVLRTLKHRLKYSPDLAMTLSNFGEGITIATVLKNTIIEVCERETYVLKYDDFLEFISSPEVETFLTNTAMGISSEEEVGRFFESLPGAKGGLIRKVLEKLAKKFASGLELGQQLQYRLGLAILDSTSEVSTEMKVLSASVGSITSDYTEKQKIKEELDEEKKRKTVFILSRIDRAKELIEAGEYEKAEVALEAVEDNLDLVEKGNQARYYNQINCIMVTRGDYLSAISALDRALELEDNLKYKSNKIICLAALKGQEDIEKAESIIEETAGIGENDSNYQYSLGVFYLETENVGAAKESFERSIELDRLNYRSWINLRGCCLKEDDLDVFDEITRDMEEALQGQPLPTDYFFHLYYGNGHRYLSEIKNNEKYFTESEPGFYVIADGALPEEIRDLADKALIEFDKASEYAADIKAQLPRIDSTFAYLIKNDLRRARAMLEGILGTTEGELAPEYEKVCIGNLGSLYLRIGDFDKAVDIYREKSSKFGDSRTDRLFLASALLGMGPAHVAYHTRSEAQIIEAISILEDLVNEDAEDLNLKNNLAVIYILRGDLVKAETLLKEIESTGDFGDLVIQNLGRVNYLNQNYEEAISYYRELVARRTGEVHAQCLLAVALAAAVFSGENRSYEEEAYRLLKECNKQIPATGPKAEALILLAEFHGNRQEWRDAYVILDELINSGLLYGSELARARANYYVCCKHLFPNITLPDSFINYFKMPRRQS